MKPHPARAAALPAMPILLALMLAGSAAPLHAAPFTPANDAEIVQRLPYRWDAATRLERAELARDPRQLPLALATARGALERSRRNGDPRELGVAQAALAAWWAQPNPPPAVRLLRATVRQSQHEFAPALADLDPLVNDPAAPLAVQAQAGLTRATVLQVTGRFADAQRACTDLSQARYAPLGPALSIAARACSAELRSLAGQPAEAAKELAALAREAPGDRWLSLLRAELAERMGNDKAAQAHFSAAAAADADVYTLAAYADWLLDRGRHREVLSLTQAPADSTLSTDSPGRDADALLLRRAIALHRLRDPQAAAAAMAMQARLAAARQRGESLHAREEARLALDVLGQPARALRLAQDNWSHQKEPADAVLLWRAARAAGQPAAADPLRAWASNPGRVDVRLVDVSPRIAHTATARAGSQP
jgi:hypothetical protein